MSQPVRVADYISAALADAGARAVFLLSGGFMMHLMDALGRHPGLQHYCNHHEQACAMAADGYARLSGTIGVAYATSGPGATNLLTGIVGAYQDSSPVLFFTGQSKRSETIYCSGIQGLRQFGFLEVNIVPIVESVTKYAVCLDDPKQVRYHVEKAIKLATSGRPGPVLIDCPLDVQGTMIVPEELPGYEDHASVVSSPKASDVRQVVRDLTSAERPVILAGHGVRCAGAVDSFRKWIAQMGIPVLLTQLAKDLLPHDHPLFIGHPGVKGDRAGNFALQTADVILSVGCSLHNQTTGYELDQFAPRAKKIQVEIDPAIMAREKCGVSTKIAADTVEFIDALSAAWPANADKRKWSAWQDRTQTWKCKYANEHEPHELGGPDSFVNAYEIVQYLNRLTDGTETIFLDAGQPFYYMGQAFKVKGRQRYLCSGGLAGMGWALPASIGGAIANPNDMMICMTGDGSLHMNVHELEVLRYHQLNVKCLIINNDGYASIRQTQETFFAGHFVGSTRASGVTLPPLEKLADTYGIPYIHCPDRKSLDSSLRETFATKGPVICGIESLREQVIIPRVPSMRLPDGRMVSRALHEMDPSLNEDEVKAALTI